MLALERRNLILTKLQEEKAGCGQRTQPAL